VFDFISTPLDMTVTLSVNKIKRRITFDATRSRLNHIIKTPRISLPTATEVISRIRPGNILINFDLSDAYFHIPVKFSHQRFMVFRHPGDRKLYKYTVLPFGISSCPYLFATFISFLYHIVRLALSHHSLVDFDSVLYLDDWLLICPLRS